MNVITNWDTLYAKVARETASAGDCTAISRDETALGFQKLAVNTLDVENHHIKDTSPTLPSLLKKSGSTTSLERYRTDSMPIGGTQVHT